MPALHRRHIGLPRFGSVAVAVGLVGACSWRAVPQGNPAFQSEDLAAFERQFFAVDRSYSPAARSQAEARIATLRAHPGEISDARFVLELAQIVALADNGHTAMLDRGSLPEMARIGIRMTPFGEDFFVVRTLAPEAELLGGRLIAIDDEPVARLRAAAHTLSGGIPSWRDRVASSFFESPGQLFALGLIQSPRQATYRFQMRGGSSREITLTADPQAASGRSPVSVLDPAPGRAGWRTLLAVDRAPWSLRDFSTPFRRRDAPDLDAMIIQLHANYDVDGESIAAFLGESDAERGRLGRKNVILDMRFNGGGDLTLTRDFMAGLPDRLPPDGRVVVLTSPWTFSAAISSIGYLKQAGGNRVVLAGEAPGDRLRFWAEGSPFSLPHSGALILPATARHDYLDGCRTFTDCHPYVRRIPIAVKSLAPDVFAPWTIDAYAAGADPGMDAAARMLRRPPPDTNGLRESISIQNKHN